MENWDYMDYQELSELDQDTQDRILDMRDSRKQVCTCIDFPCCGHTDHSEF